MNNEDNKEKKCKDDEYSILKDESHKEDSLLKWMSFNKNATRKSYNLDDIFKDDTYILRKNETNILKNDENNSNMIDNNVKKSILGKYNTIVSPKKPYLDDMSKLKENNISLKRYLETVKDTTNPFANNSNNNVTGIQSIVNSTKANEKPSTKMNHLLDSTIVSDQKQSEINKKDLLANISQIRGDLSKCTNLLKRKSELLTNPSVINEVYPKHIKRSDVEMSKIHEESDVIHAETCLSKDISLIPDTQVIYNNVGEVKNIYQFHSSLIETKRKISKAIEDIQRKEDTKGNVHNDKVSENVDIISEIYLNKIEAHKKTEENYKKEINNLERELIMRDIEISRLKSKLSYCFPQTDNISLNNIIDSGKECINLLKENLVQTEKEVKLELEKALNDNKKLECELIGTKRIINKLADKIKALKNKNE